MGKYISAYTGAEIDAAVAKLANQTLSSIDASIAYTQGQQAIKKYVALISQGGIAVPVAIVLENTIGNIVWSYSDVGKYLATLIGAFPAGKTAVLTPSSATKLLDLSYHQCSAQRNNDNSILLASYSILFDDPFYYPDYKDSLLGDGIVIEIRVYP